MSYYPRIRDLREDSDKKQFELAEYLGTTTQYYGLYEKGANEISFERAIQLADYYDVSLDYIAGRTNNKNGFASEKISDAQWEMLEMMNSFSDDEKKKALSLLKKMIEIID